MAAQSACANASLQKNIWAWNDYSYYTFELESHFEFTIAVCPNNQFLRNPLFESILQLLHYPLH
jgi:hypothetical protein